MRDLVHWKWILLSALILVGINCLPANSQKFFQENQLSIIDVSNDERSIIEQQLKNQFSSGAPRACWADPVYCWDGSGLLKKYRILQILVGGIFPDGNREHPKMGPFCIFAFDGNKLIYLNGPNAKNNLSSVLKAENCPLEMVEPDKLASLFCLTILQKNDDSATVLSSPDDLKTYAKVKYDKLDLNEFNKCAAQIKSPHIDGNQKTGWKISFCTLHGQMETGITKNVSSYQIEISPQYNLSLQEKVLSSNIFSYVRQVVY
jgi:hypothetical protein